MKPEFRISLAGVIVFILLAVGTVVLGLLYISKKSPTPGTYYVCDKNTKNNTKLSVTLPDIKPTYQYICK